jgi:hypothetical protein
VHWPKRMVQGAVKLDQRCPGGLRIKHSIELTFAKKMDADDPENSYPCGQSEPRADPWLRANLAHCMRAMADPELGQHVTHMAFDRRHRTLEVARDLLVAEAAQSTATPLSPVSSSSERSVAAAPDGLG